MVLNLQSGSFYAKLSRETGKISKILNCWQLLVRKNNCYHKLVYIMSPLPSSKSYLKDINQLLYNFLWDKKGDKIKRLRNWWTKVGHQNF